MSVASELPTLKYFSSQICETLGLNAQKYFNFSKQNPNPLGDLEAKFRDYDPQNIILGLL